MRTILVSLAASRFLTTSLVIHVVLIACLGSVVIFRAAQEPPGLIGSIGEGVIYDDEQEPKSSNDVAEFEDLTAPLPSETSSASQASVIASLTGANSFSIAAPVETQMMGTSFSGTEIHSSSSAASSTVRGAESALSRGSGKLRGTLSGVDIEAAKLGVILDISGSAHGSLHRPLQEIQAYGNAVVVLFSGCGMREAARKRDFRFKRGDSIKRGTLKDAGDAPTTVGEVLDLASSKNLELKNALPRVLKNPNLYGTEWDKDTPSDLRTFGAHFAFQKLISEGVDSIYWFADFQDPLDTKVVDQVIRALKQRGIKVYCHNFSGAFPNPEQAAIVKKIATETGGSSIPN